MNRKLDGVRVLVVDDDPASAKLAAVILRGEGCEVTTAGDAEDATAILGTYQPEVIILDLILPLMSGLTFAQQVKKNPTTAAAAIIAVTVFNGPEVEQSVLASGCAAYLRKPIDPTTLVATVCAHLGGPS
jgi:CheY-like chemotaxis protein